MIKRDIKRSNILIYTDSQISISTLDRGYTNTKTALECIKKLKKLRRSNNFVKICWVPKEIHALGNTIADKLAREATEKDEIDEIFPDLQFREIFREIEKYQSFTFFRSLSERKKGNHLNILWRFKYWKNVEK